MKPIRKSVVVISTILFLASTGVLALAAWVNNQNASIVIGHLSMTQGGVNTNQNANTLYSPHSVYSDGTKLYIADTSNNRVLIFNSIPTTNNANADIVIGQPDMTSISANQGGNPNANTLYAPISVYINGTKLYVADASNNRVLIFNTIPTTSNASADVVVGQTNMTSNIVGQSVNGLWYPTSVFTDGTKLYVADQNNNRVMIYNTIPTTNSASANVVVGQTDMTSHSANQGGTVNANTLCAPSSVYTDGTKLYIADNQNNRVLIYNTIPTANNASADVVVGQTNMTSNSANQGGSPNASTLYYPSSVFVNGTKLYITDFYNLRVLIYNTIPTANNTSADVVVGEPNMTSNSGGQSANTLYYPYFVFTNGTKLYIADRNNHRVMIYNTIPTANNASADVVVGQPDMTSHTGLLNVATANTLNDPHAVYSDGTKLYVADSVNNRVLIFNTIPTTNNANADVVVGQANMTSNSVNQGASVNSNTLNNPSSVFIYGTKLYIADSSNNRILIYNSIPTTNNANADVVIGQPNMTSNSSGTSANTLWGPTSVCTDGTKLFIASIGHHRVLIYNTIPTANNASADVVIGQPDMISNSINQGIGVNANTLYEPHSVSVSGTKLVIADSYNNRVLIFNTIPTANNASADVVVGQPNMTSGTGNQGGLPNANTLFYPRSVFTDGTKLYIADYGNYRVLIYNSANSERGWTTFY